MKTASIFKKYGYFWVTLLLFLFSLAGHWFTAWFAYTADQQSRNQPINIDEYFIQTARDTLENWQSEFLQLIWQVAGLSYLLYLGSPQSKEGDDRKEEKIDKILRKVGGQEGETVIAKLDKKYPRK